MYTIPLIPCGAGGCAYTVNGVTKRAATIITPATFVIFLSIYFFGRVYRLEREDVTAYAAQILELAQEIALKKSPEESLKYIMDNYIEKKISEFEKIKRMLMKE